MRTALVLAGLLWLAGCSIVFDPDSHTAAAGSDAGSEDSGLDAAGGPARIAASDFCAELADSYCTGRRSCCAAATMERHSECTEGFTLDCQGLLTDEIQRASNGYDEVVAAQVVEELHDMTEAPCSLDVLDWVTSINGFFRVFQGTLPIGRNCGPLDRLSCDRPNLCRPSGPAGATCGELPNMIGARCLLDFDCLSNLVCLPDVTMGLGRSCQTRVGEGETCMKDYHCMSGICSDVDATCLERTGDLVWCANPFDRNPIQTPD